MRSHVLELSRTDPLTTLFNRSQLSGTLEQEVSRTRRSDRGFCLLMIDLDGLKTINDTLGHHRGDEVLRAVGGVIRGSIRNVDTAYRFGGDEFLVLLPETDIAGAFVVAEKIRSGAEEVGVSVTGSGTDTSVSIGLVSHPEDGLSAEELMIAADRAMYQAKSLGKNQISGNPRPRRLIARGLPARGADRGGARGRVRAAGRPGTAGHGARCAARGSPTRGDRRVVRGAPSQRSLGTGPDRHSDGRDPHPGRRPARAATRRGLPHRQPVATRSPTRRSCDARLPPRG